MASKSGYLYLILCILFWASIPVVSKKILVELNNLQMLFYSTIFSFIVLGIILLIQKKHKIMKKYSAKDYLNMAFLGFLGTYLYYVLLYGALALTTAQEGFILAYTWPILVLILAFVILKEKVTLKKILAILVSFFGIIIIVTQGNIHSLTLTNFSGDFLALSGAFVFALFSILGKKYNFDKTVSAFIYFLSALIFITITLFIFSTPKIPSLNIWIWLMFNGILVNGVTYIWWFKALEKVETSIISTALYLTPFISLIYIWLFLDEKILLSSILGLVVIVAGILIQSYKNRK
ncbi:MAG: DMT family transporter [Nanoarchaeota archaeon]|nr:DMT family transporter [Nanoarchaeota archaeon]MBU4086358.1 DMT family transporter [Nanoarchaeota archaeon]